MFHYSRKSFQHLNTCHPDLIRIFREVIKEFDCTIVSGHRKPSQQLDLFCLGRLSDDDIVTYRDGYNKKSKHNHFPSLAVDVVPHPTFWTGTEKIKELSIIVFRIAAEMNINIKWGGNWKHFKDYAHYYLDD